MSKMQNLKTWDQIKSVITKYPSIFKPSTLTFKVFHRFNAIINTRCFGSNLPSSSLVPMADNFNHRNKHCTWSLVNTKLHKNPDVKSKYFITGRFLEDVSPLFPPSALPNRNISGWLNKELFEKNYKAHSVENFRKLINTQDAWQIPWYRTYDVINEDNIELKVDNRDYEKENKENPEGCFAYDALKEYIRD
jgi:hypothetical protein